MTAALAREKFPALVARGVSVVGPGGAEVRAHAARFIGAGSPGEIVFVSGATAGLNAVPAWRGVAFPGMLEEAGHQGR